MTHIPHPHPNDKALIAASIAAVVKNYISFIKSIALLERGQRNHFLREILPAQARLGENETKEIVLSKRHLNAIRAAASMSHIDADAVSVLFKTLFCQSKTLAKSVLRAQKKDSKRQKKKTK